MMSALSFPKLPGDCSDVKDKHKHKKIKDAMMKIAAPHHDTSTMRPAAMALMSSSL